MITGKIVKNPLFMDDFIIHVERCSPSSRHHPECHRDPGGGSRGDPKYVLQRMNGPRAHSILGGMARRSAPASMNPIPHRRWRMHLMRRWHVHRSRMEDLTMTTLRIESLAARLTTAVSRRTVLRSLAPVAAAAAGLSVLGAEAQNGKGKHHQHRQEHDCQLRCMERGDNNCNRRCRRGND
jgi:hypothetical protein